MPPTNLFFKLGKIALTLSCTKGQPAFSSALSRLGCILATAIKVLLSLLDTLNPIAVRRALFDRSSAMHDTHACIVPLQAEASAQMGTLLPREKHKAAYDKALVQRYQHMPDIRRIARHRHVPAAIYKVPLTGNCRD